MAKPAQGTMLAVPKTTDCTYPQGPVAPRKFVLEEVKQDRCRGSQKWSQSLQIALLHEIFKKQASKAYKGLQALKDLSEIKLQVMIEVCLICEFLGHF